MSLYVGNNNSGRGVLHITSTVETTNALKSGPLSNTVFHNDLPYRTWTKYNKTGSTVRSSTGIRWTLYDGSASRDNVILHEAVARNDHIRSFEFAGLPILGPELDYYILDESGNLIDPVNLTFWSEAAPGSGVGCYDSLRPDKYDQQISLGRIQSVPQYASASTADTTIGSIVVLTDTIPIGGDTVNISNGDIRIDSTSLLDFKYVAVTGHVNNHPSTITIDSSTQLIDAGAVSGSLELVSNSAGTFIKKGDHNIIQSTGAFSNLTSSTVYTVPSGDVIPRTYVNGEPIRITIEGTVYNTIASEGGFIDFGSFDNNDYSIVYTKRLDFSTGNILVTNTKFTHANGVTTYYDTVLTYETFI